MKTLLDWVKDVQAKRGYSLRLVPNQNLAYRAGKNWQNLSGNAWSAAEVRNTVWPLLTAEEKKHLEENRSLQGFFRGLSGPLRFQFLSSETGLTANFKWHNEGERDLNEWAVPAFTLEKMQRLSGLSLFYGPVESGKSSLLMALAKHLATQGAGPVQFYSDKEEFAADPLVHRYPAEALLSIDPADLPSRYVFVDTQDRGIQQRALALAGQGLSIFVAVPAKTFSAALLQLTEALPDQGRAWESVAENLVAALGLRLIAGLEMGLQPVFELAADTPEIKELLRKGSVQGLVETMSKGGDKSGMRTLNQALLQLLLKRKIELRTGFDESPNPQELDDLLKKVGV